MSTKRKGRGLKGNRFHVVCSRCGCVGKHGDRAKAFGHAWKHHYGSMLCAATEVQDSAALIGAPQAWSHDGHPLRYREAPEPTAAERIEP